MIYCLLLSLDLSFSFPRLRPFISSFHKNCFSSFFRIKVKSKKLFFHSFLLLWFHFTLDAIHSQKKKDFFVLLKIKIWKMLLLLYWIIFISSMCTISDIYISYFSYFSMHCSLYCTNNNSSNGVVIRTNFKRHV